MRELLETAPLQLPQLLVTVVNDDVVGNSKPECCGWLNPVNVITANKIVSKFFMAFVF
jgi:hypothetical protein